LRSLRRVRAGDRSRRRGDRSVVVTDVALGRHPLLHSSDAIKGPRFAESAPLRHPPPGRLAPDPGSAATPSTDRRACLTLVLLIRPFAVAVLVVVAVAVSVAEIVLIRDR